MSEVAQRVMTTDEAHRLTERIRVTAINARDALEKLRDLLDEAQSGRAHIALGYKSWTAYLADVMGEQPLRLPREQRQELVGYLAGEGMSTRAIAPIVGATHMTVQRDLAMPPVTNVPAAETPVRNLTPAQPARTQRVDTETAPASTIPQGEPVSRAAGAGAQQVRYDSDEVTGPALTDELGRVVRLTGPGSVSSPTPRPVTGLDGKSYARPEPKAPCQPKRRPLTDAFWTATHDLRKVTERIERLMEDDRFAQNAEKVATANRSDLIRARDLLQQVIDRLPEGASTLQENDIR